MTLAGESSAEPSPPPPATPSKRRPSPSSPAPLEENSPNKRKRTRWGQAPTSHSASSNPFGEGGSSKPMSKIDFEVRATAARAALDRVKASTGAFTSAVSPPNASGLTVLNQAGVLNAAGVPVSAAGMTLAAQQQLMLMQKLHEDRQQSVNSILESLKGRLPFALKTGLGGGAGGETKSTAQKFDDVGRLLDEHGNVVPLPKPKYATLKINKALFEGANAGGGGGAGAAPPGNGVAGAGGGVRDFKRVLYKLSKHSLKPFSDPSQNPYFDPSLKVATNKLKKTGLRFVESGFYLRRQQNLERKQGRNENDTLESLPLGGNVEEDRVAKARQLADQFVKGSQPGQRRKHAQDNIFNASRLGGARKDAVGGEELDGHSLATVPVSRQAAVPLQRKREDTFPEIEWWDANLVERLSSQDFQAKQKVSAWRKEGRSGWTAAKTPEEAEEAEFATPEFPFRIKEAALGHLVEHPVPIEPETERDSSKIPVAMFLTEKERKKMRRQKRRESEREKQDKIRMGLIPVDPPKIKLSNLMRVLGEEAVANPTRIEQKVRSQVADRVQSHEARNAARKLPAEKRLEKTKMKWMQKEEVSICSHLLVFRLQDITDKKHLFKMNKNAQQLYLSGAAVLCPGIGNLVVAEGGPRAIRKFKALMLRRIRWADEFPAAQAAKPFQETFCTLMWEGPVKDKIFRGWQIVSCASEDEAVVALQELKAEQYWAMMKRFRDRNLDLIKANPAF